MQRAEKLLDELYDNYRTCNSDNDLNKYRGAIKMLQVLGYDYHKDLSGKHTIEQKN